jgi:tight adherence protein B
MGIFIIASLISISTGLAVFALYPFAEQQFLSWQKRRMERFTPKLDNMFIYIPSRKLLLIDIGCPLAVGLLVFFLTGKILFALVAAFLGLIIVAFIIRQLEIARRRKFARQLVDALMLLSGSLKAGLSLLQAFETLVEEMPAPISQEFALVLRENRMGVPLEDCLVRLKRRMDCEDLNTMVTAMLVARETGGNITTIFSNLVMTIRERDRLLQKVKALCIQSKIQGKILMVLPVIFAFGVYKLDPHFLDVMTQDPVGRALLIYAVFSGAIGIFLISRLSKIEV